MSVMYDWYENPGNSEESGEQELHPRVFLNGKMSTAKLCELIHDRCSLTVGDVKNALDSLTTICAEQLGEGRSVQIEGLGYFAPVLQSTEKVTRSTKNKWNKVSLKTIAFRPDAQLKGQLVGIRMHQSKYASHSENLSAVMVDMRLKEYFAEHDVLTRYDFQNLCTMTRTTANRHLRRLQDEGKLKNVGRLRQPVYVAVQGFYGVSRDEAVRR